MSTDSSPANAVGSSALPSNDALPLVDRRVSGTERKNSGFERRQFSNSYRELSPPAKELAEAIDNYKMLHRRRFINFEEMLAIIVSLGYKK
jgi:hypothetical protein